MTAFNSWLAVAHAMNAPGVGYAPMAAQRSGPSPHMRRLTVSPGNVGALSAWDVIFPGKAATDALFVQREINSLNQDINTFRADVAARVVGTGPPPPPDPSIGPGSQYYSGPQPGLGAILPFSTKLEDYYARWSAFYVAHTGAGGVLANIGAAEELARLKAEYIALRSEWTDGLKQKTSAPSGKPGDAPWPSWLKGVLAVAGIVAGAAVVITLGGAAAPAIGALLTKKAAAKVAVAAL